MPYNPNHPDKILSDAIHAALKEYGWHNYYENAGGMNAKRYWRHDDNDESMDSLNDEELGKFIMGTI